MENPCLGLDDFRWMIWGAPTFVRNLQIFLRGNGGEHMLLGIKTWDIHAFFKKHAFLGNTPALFEISLCTVILSKSRHTLFH